MKRWTSLMIAIGTILLSSPATAADATAAWNSVAATYNFATGPVPASWTFEDAYNGSDFHSDFVGVMHAVGEIMTTPGVASGDDVMEATLTNWPD